MNPRGRIGFAELSRLGGIGSSLLAAKNFNQYVSMLADAAVYETMAVPSASFPSGLKMHGDGT
jgi:hypothetical protein